MQEGIPMSQSARSLISVCLTAMLFGCTVQKYEVSQPLPNPASIPLNDIAAFAFVNQKDLTINFYWMQMKRFFMGAGGFLIWPVPTDLRDPYFPEIRPDQISALEFDPALSAAINRQLSNDQSMLELNGPADLNRLKSLAREKRKRYIYLIVYNEFDEGPSVAVNGSRVLKAWFKDSQWTGEGSLIMASRILIDVQTDEIVLNQQRFAERSYWVPLFGNGVENSRFSYDNDKRFDYIKYVEKVGAPDEATAVRLTAAHLIQTDLLPQKAKK